METEEKDGLDVEVNNGDRLVAYAQLIVEHSKGFNNTEAGITQAKKNVRDLAEAVAFEGDTKDTKDITMITIVTQMMLNCLREFDDPMMRLLLLMAHAKYNQNQKENKKENGPEKTETVGDTPQN